MKLIGIRTPKPRKYSYKPIYYDPVKEERENRFKETGYGDNQAVSELRMRMQLRMNRKKMDEPIRKRARMISIFFTVLLLLLLVYYIFF